MTIVGSPYVEGEIRIDRYVTKVLRDLKRFTDWLTANNVRGLVGEFAWPNDQPSETARWNALADAYYKALDQAGLWAMAFMAAELQPDWRVCFYSGASDTAPQALAVTQATAAPIEAHPTAGGVLRGVHMLGGESGMEQTVATCPSSNAREAAGWAFAYTGSAATFTATDGTGGAMKGYGAYGGGKYSKCWNYGSSAGYSYLAGRGIKLIRLPFRWERVQRSWSGALDATEIARLDEAIGWIGAAGMQVVLDAHNFGQYYLDDGSQGVATSIGGTTATNTHFADLWSRLATRYKDNATVVGYDLCNEPNQATNWYNASGPAQAAVTAIRATGSTQLVVVSGGAFSSVSWFPGKKPWITDSGNNLRYQAHHYWNYSGAQSGAYAATYSAELTAA